MKKYDRICIMLPTYGRADTKLPVFIDSMMKMADDLKNICMSFVVKENDKKTIEVIREKCGVVLDYEIITENEPDCDLASFFNMSYEKTKFDDESTCVSMFGDDMVFKTRGWDTIMLDAINDIGGMGIVYGDDDFIQHENLCVYFVTTRDFVDLTGKPFMADGVKYDFIDNVWMEVGRKLNCLKYIPKLHIFHDHASGKGGKDETWVRMRANVKHNTLIQIDDYTEEIAANVRKNLREKYRLDDVVFVMTTYNRLKLLRQTVDSWNRSIILPEKIFVFDDCSEEYPKVAREIKRMKGAVLISGETHLGCNGNNVAAITMPEKCGAVMVIDSDTTFATNWFIAVCEAWKQIEKDEEVAGASIFNTTTHKEAETKKKKIGEMVFKNAVGGFGALYKKSIIDKSIGEHVRKQAVFSWDHRIIDYVNKNNMLFCCTEKSYLQHIGFCEGTHLSDGEMSDFAEEYVGEDEVTNVVENKSRMMPGQTVLFAAMARLGDIVAASMVANMVIEEGATLTWLVINRYEQLVKRLCPRAKIIAVEPLTGPEAEWSETTTEKMMQTYTGYRYYINAQVGARENHYNYVTSGKHPCEWMRDRCDLILGTELGSNFKDYLEFNTDGISLDQRDYKPVKSLALICPESVTVNNIIDEELLKKNIAELRAKGYTPKILSKKRPRGISIRQARDEYIFGMTVEQCILILIRDVMFFVGQDSGMTWCSLFSDCKKRVYHNKSRIDMTNTYFSVIDKNAEDIVLED